MAWSYHADALEALDAIIAGGFTPVALESTGSAEAVDSICWPARTCLVIGNEVDGVSPRLLERCETHASIPMAGVKESFNVAVAFAVAAHTAARALADEHPSVRFH